MSILKLFNQAEQKVLDEVKVVEGIFKKEEAVAESDLNGVFAKAKQLAAAANAEVDNLKAQLAQAIKKAADLSDAAAQAAKSAADEAQAKATALATEAQAHADIAAQQASQIVVAPTPAVDPAPTLAAQTPLVVPATEPTPTAATTDTTPTPAQ